jgi:hypothetical protein
MPYRCKPQAGGDGVSRCSTEQGPRAGEALGLDLVDVVLDLDPACLSIREAKFHKTRLTL